MKGIFWNKGWNNLSVQDIVFSLLSPVRHTVHRGFSASSFFYESAGDQKSVKQQKRDNTSVDHTVSYMPPQLHSNMPEEENRNDCSLKSSHLPLCANLVEPGKRAKQSVNETGIDRGSGEPVWSLLQISPCSQQRRCGATGAVPQDVLDPPPANPWISLQKQKEEVWGQLLEKLHYSLSLTDFKLNLHEGSGPICKRLYCTGEEHFSPYQQTSN